MAYNETAGRCGSVLYCSNLLLFELLISCLWCPLRSFVMEARLPANWITRNNIYFWFIWQRCQQSGFTYVVEWEYQRWIRKDVEESACGLA
jgi:hypothetical protein